ncbi:MAG: alpha/beta hydrolase-fold protein [Candidatus Sumerlaeaceae bacterium]|nr:alpha/beta hydrolase-fold protein [Candidatus Sumerlaeaceae bacterium]
MMPHAQVLLVPALMMAILLPLPARADSTTPTVTLTVRVGVPPQTPTVYMPGSLPELGPWDPARFPLKGDGTTRTAVLSVPRGSTVEFKFTLGSWETEALTQDGRVPGNHVIAADRDKEVEFVVTAFKQGPDKFLDDIVGSGVLGRLIIMRDVESKHLNRRRHVSVWFPPEYDENPDKRFPLLVMHDGQNLFDPRIAHTGVDWGVDECIVRLAKAGRIEPPVVVGVWNTADRALEYSPWHEGPAYARFLIEELLPRIRKEYRILSGPENTATMGSSMGGLISFYLCWKHPETFGRAGCVSTHWPFNGQRDLDGAPPLILDEIARDSSVPTTVTLYFDYGTTGIDARYEPLQSRVNDWLTSQGLKIGRNFVVHKFDGADHNEAAWRARLDKPMEFLFGKRDREQGDQQP